MAYMLWLKKRAFIIKILLPSFSSIGLFIVAFFLVLIPWFEGAIMDRKRETIRELTSSALSILEQAYEKEQTQEISRAEAQALAIGQIRKLRYGDNRQDYFWLTDMHPTMIMHPYRPDYDNQDLTNFRDSHGKRLFFEMAEVIRTSGRGYVDYMWQWMDDSSRIVPKLSYVSGFPQWNWIIGTGIYIEDVRNEIKMLESRITNISIGITVLISLLLSFITFQNLRSERQRVRAENELRESREKYRTLVEASTEGLIMILEGSEIYYNKTFLTMFGFSEDNESEIRPENIFAESPAADIFRSDPQSGREGFFGNYEARLKHRHGYFINVLLLVSPISFMGKRGVVISVRDMSVHEQIKVELDESKEKYISLTNQLTIGVFRASSIKDGKFIEANPAAVAILGIPGEEELVNSSLNNFFDDPDEGNKFFAELVQNESVKNRILQLHRASGEKVFIAVSAVLVKDKNGTPLYYDGILEDITEQRRSDIERDNLISELQTSLLLLNQPLEPFIRTVPVCDFDATVLSAVETMTLQKREIIMILSNDKVPMGVLTDSDIRERVLAKGISLNEKVFQFMSAPLVTVQSSSTLFDALLIFDRNKIKHLPVLECNGKISGAINAYDIQKAFHSSYMFFIRRISESGSAEEVKSLSIQLRLLIKTLVERETGIRNVTRMNTIISDTVTKRLIELAIREIGVPPVKFAFMALGSEGREEQTLATDQDNAIIFEDVPQDKFETTQKYFLRLGNWICGALDTVGYQFCKGKVMAQNPEWCQPLSQWKSYITKWVTESTPQDLLEVKIFFDFRTVYGEKILSDRLREHLLSVTAVSNPFFIYLTESVLSWEIPDGVQKLKIPVDIKKIILPLIDLARIYALKHSVLSTNTLERVTALYEKDVFSLQKRREFVQMYDFLMRIRFKRQVELLSENRPADNIIDPQILSEIDAVLFKKILQSIKDFQNTLSLDLKGVLARR